MPDSDIAARKRSSEYVVISDRCIRLAAAVRLMQIGLFGLNEAGVLSFLSACFCAKQKNEESNIC